MQATSTQVEPTYQQAITDLYDERNNTFLVQFPPVFVVATGLVGVIIFAITGFFGYVPPQGSGVSMNLADQIFRQPWLLFLWFSALMLTLIWSILRDKSLKRQRYQAIIVTLIAIAFVMLAYFFRDQFQGIIDAINSLLSNIHIKLGGGLSFAIINYGLITIFWVDSIRRWIRRSRNLPIAPAVDIGLRTNAEDATFSNLVPSLPEIVAGDLIAGGLLTALLWLAFLPSTLEAVGSVIGIYKSGDPAPMCAGDCSTVDRNQLFFYVACGLMVLALTALVNGLAAMNAVSVDRANVSGISENVLESGTQKGTKGVVQTLLETLLGIFGGRGGQKVGIGFAAVLALAFRTAGWPALLVIGTGGLAVTAQHIQYYMHEVSCLTPHAQLLTCDNSLSHIGFSELFINGGLAAVGVLIAVTAIALSAALLLYQGRIVENTFKFLQLIGLVILLTGWIFSLALSGFNALISFVLGWTQRWPFAQPDVTTLLSFGPLVIYSVLLLISLRRGERNQRFTPIGLPSQRRR